MHFISMQTLLDDVRAWSNELPDDIVAVAGIPRSGLLVATLLALHRNLHLVTLESLKRRETPWEQSLRRGVASKADGKVLIVDDSLNSGETIQEVWQELTGNPNLLYGAVYYRDENVCLLDFAYRQVPAPRCFEWNLFHCQQMQYACLDFDGVLCEDWLGREEDQGAGLQQYLDHLEQARPLHLPCSFPVLAIVTSRLEKYRTQTESWLSRHGVRYGQLVMSPHSSPAARRAAADNANRKAEFYAGCRDARLFIESDQDQSREIARLTCRPVLCASTMHLYQS